MSSELHYKSNLRDLQFNLFEWLKIQDTTLSKAPYTALDEDSLKESLKVFEAFCSTTVAKGFAEGDKVPLKLDSEGNVTLPPGTRDAINAFYDAEWHMFDAPEHLGGFGAPESAYWSMFEMLVGANPPVALYLFTTFIGSVIDRAGTEDQKKRFVRNLYDKRWGATMVLTEADAGSDVGAAKCKAKHVGDNVWEITGTKRFITNGDFDTAENIVHMVLARPEGAGVGTKGLSLFIVPKYWVHEDGTMGDRNGAVCTNIEDKMGIKASATCEMTFGEKIPAKGLLVGDVHDGIRQMFLIIEQARMAVGTKSMATLSTAYLHALEYAQERVQGSDLLKIMEKDAPRVAIMNHPDVKRSLMLQKCNVEGMRALGLFAAHLKDQSKIAEKAGDEKQAKIYRKQNDFLLPLIKGYSSEKCYDLLNASLQIFGGSGYLKDYPIEQYIRDQKIDSLYEGTTHIQSLDLVFRKIARDGGKTIQGFMSQMTETLEQRREKEVLAKSYDKLAEALTDCQAIMATMMQKMGDSLYHVGLHGNKILSGIAQLTIGWLLVKQAELAKEKLTTAKGDDANFYEGKIAACQFFCQNCLPEISLSRKLIEDGDLELMEVKDSHF